MATILYTTSFGSDDPTRASIPFVSALGAIESGNDAEIALLGEATFLLKDEIVAQMHGVGWPPLQELWSKVIEHEVPVYV